MFTENDLGGGRRLTIVMGVTVAHVLRQERRRRHHRTYSRLYTVPVSIYLSFCYCYYYIIPRATPAAVTAHSDISCTSRYI